MTPRIAFLEFHDSKIVFSSAPKTKVEPEHIASNNQVRVSNVSHKSVQERFVEIKKMTGKYMEENV